MNREIMERAVASSPKAARVTGVKGLLNSTDPLATVPAVSTQGFTRTCSLRKFPSHAFKLCQALQYVPHELQKEALEVVKSSPEVAGKSACSFMGPRDDVVCVAPIAPEAVAQLERSTTIAGIAPWQTAEPIANER